MLALSRLTTTAIHVNPSHEPDAVIDIPQDLDHFLVARQLHDALVEMLVITDECRGRGSVAIRGLVEEGDQFVDLVRIAQLGGDPDAAAFHGSSQLIDLVNLLRVERTAKEALARYGVKEALH